MDSEYALFVAQNTGAMLQAKTLLQTVNIVASMVPAPPESGTVCAIALRFLNTETERVNNILLNEYKLPGSIFPDRKLKLQGFIDAHQKHEVSDEFLHILQKIQEGDDLNQTEIVYLLDTDRAREIEIIREAADRIRKEMVGDTVEIRGAIEFSNYCDKFCVYCGIGAHNKKVNRYRMTIDEIIEGCHEIARLGMRTVVLQSGEDPYWTTDKLCELFTRVKKECGLRITVSVGEASLDDYKKMKAAGGDNYLLKIESRDKDLYANLHPGDSVEDRIKASENLKEAGFLLGSGSMLGLPGQTSAHIAKDILFFKEIGANMIGIGPFLPAADTPLEHHPAGTVTLSLRATAVTRIVCKRVFIPSTTALSSLHSEAQVEALRWGANALMLICTPSSYRKSYKLYDNKNMVDLAAAKYAVTKAGRKFPPYLKLDELKRQL